MYVVLSHCEYASIVCALVLRAAQLKLLFCTNSIMGFVLESNLNTSYLAAAEYIQPKIAHYKAGIINNFKRCNFCEPSSFSSSGNICYSNICES